MRNKNNIKKRKNSKNIKKRKSSNRKNNLLRGFIWQT